MRCSSLIIFRFAKWRIVRCSLRGLISVRALTLERLSSQYYIDPCYLAEALEQMSVVISGPIGYRVIVTVNGDFTALPIFLF